MNYTVILFIKPTLFNDFNHLGQLLCDFASPRLSKDNWSFFKVSCWWPIGGRRVVSHRMVRQTTINRDLTKLRR